MSIHPSFEPLAAHLRTFMTTALAGSRQEEQFDRLAHELFALQFQHNTPYRRLCEARGVSPQTVRHWSQIPAVPTAAFKELEFTCLPPEARTAAFHSSGTTEQRPSRHFHSRASLALYEASIWPWFQAHALPDPPSRSISLLSLSPAPEAAPHSSLVHMFEVIRCRLGAPESTFVGQVQPGGWDLDLPAVVRRFQAAVAGGQPLLVLGTAFLFVHLLDYLAEQGLSLALPPGSRGLETGGYKGRSRTLPKAELHALIQQRFGLPQSHILCEYGMSELSSQAYDLTVGKPAQGNSEGRQFQFPPWARVQIVSPETGQEVGEGETGLVRICDLANAYSVMAIQTEDLGVRRGQGFELLGRAWAAEPRGCSLMAT